MSTQKPAKPEKSPKTTKIKLNVRFLACLLALVAVLGVGVHFVHGFQVKRNAVGLLQQADRARDADETAKEIDSLGRYLRMVPEDWDALARYAGRLDDMAKAAKRPQARVMPFLHFEAVLRNQPDRDDIRRQQVERALAIGRFAEAILHLEPLLKKVAKPQNDEDRHERAELERFMGLAEAGRGKNLPKAREAFEKSIEDYPDQLESYLLAADLLFNRLKEPEEAYIKLKNMVNNSSKELEARKYRSQRLLQYATKTHLSSEAEAYVAADVKELQKKNPSDPDVILLAADFARVDSRVKNKLEEVRCILKEGVRVQPRNERLYVNLISAEIAEGRLEEAREDVEKGLKEVPNSLDLQYALAEMQVLKGELDEARQNIKRLRAAKFDVGGRRNTAPRLDYLEARIQVREGRWSEASQMLQKIRPDMASRSPEMEAQSLLMQAQCHERLGNPEQALLAYREAQKLDPLSVPARFGAGLMLLTLGSPDDAATEFQRLLGLSNPPRGTHLLVAQALITLNMQLPLDKREVKPIFDELERAKQEKPDAPELPLLEAQALLLKGGGSTDRVEKMIRDQAKAHPDRVELWVALAQFAGRRGDAKEALDILDEAAKEHPKLREHVELHLARLNYLIALPPIKATDDPAEREREREKQLQDARKKVEGFEQDMPPLPKAERLRLLGGLAEAYARLGRDAETERLWKKIADEQPTNLNVRLLLFDRALLAGDDAEIVRRLEEIKRIEGPQGAFGNYGEASRLVEETIRESKREASLSEAGRAKLIQARKHLQQAARQRPRWPRIPSLEAEIHQLEGNSPSAIDKYQQALKQGETRPTILRQLVRLLFETRRFAEANQVVREFLNQESTLVLAGLGKLATEALLTGPDQGARDADHIEKMAENAVKGSNSYLDYLWLGRVRWALGKHAAAREALQLALQKGEKAPETWVTMVAFLVEMKQKDEAKDLIQKARTKVPADQLSLTLAACYEALGDLEKTEKFLKDALAAKPDDPLASHNLANYYLFHNRPKEAEVHLNNLLASPAIQLDEKLWARRSLSLVKASDTKWEGFKQAKELLEQNLKEGKNGLADRHALALLLATRGNDRAKAIRMLEELGKWGPLTINERFALVALYLQEDNWEMAQRHMMTLLTSSEGKNPTFVSFYARHLLRHGKIEEAQLQLKVLEQTQPNSHFTKEIEARLRKAQGRHDQAKAAVQEFARCKDMDLGQGAKLLEELGQPLGKDAKSAEARQVEAIYRDEANTMLHKYVDEDPKQPESPTEARLVPGPAEKRRRSPGFVLQGRRDAESPPRGRGRGHGPRPPGRRGLQGATPARGKLAQIGAGEISEIAPVDGLAGRPVRPPGRLQ